MRKTLIYTSFVIVSSVVILTFVTATTYAQLGIAILLYPALVYFGLTIFPSTKTSSAVYAIQTPRTARVSSEPVQSPSTMPAEPALQQGKVEIADVDKRAFLKLIGAAGVSFFLFSLFNRRLDVLLPSERLSSIPPSPSPLAPERQPFEGYHIAEIDDDIISYYGFINKSGAWIIMREDTEVSSFRYAKGEANFPDNWGRRGQLEYNYFYNLF